MSRAALAQLTAKKNLVCLLDNVRLRLLGRGKRSARRARLDTDADKASGRVTEMAGLGMVDCSDRNDASTAGTIVVRLG